ncbi:MAG: hypothetical protein K9H16_07155, partial [Bacteroidales bacterium]|nr:hypothetical protein [Bacteroidales bacterium]
MKTTDLVNIYIFTVSKNLNMQNPSLLPRYSGLNSHSLSFAIILSFIQIFTLAGNSPNVAPQLDKSPVELSYSYPDQVEAGTTFTFTITLKKDLNYRVPGMIKCRFAGGLMPENTSIESVDFLKEENTIVLKWQELSGSNIITF